jgi:hypothetical protein
MNGFSRARFVRVFINDLLLHARRIGIATLALLGVGLVAYLTNLEPGPNGPPRLYLGFFAAALIGGGLLLTSTIFADLHHPLRRYQALTLPCSGLERFVGRYLLTGPLFYLYVLVLSALFDRVAAALALAAFGRAGASFAPFEPSMLEIARNYFWLHALVFGGAIFFRGFALAKTLLAICVVGFSLLLVQLVAVRLLFWRYFTTWLPQESELPGPQFVPPTWLTVPLLAAFVLWVLYVAYQCLREHEVQGEV